MKSQPTILETQYLPKGDDVQAGLEGPSKTITVEPVEEPLYVPEDVPVEEPVKV